MLRMVLCALAISTVAAAGHQACAADRDAMARGEVVFRHWCAACHGPGPDHPGTQALALKYGRQIPDTIEDRTDLTPGAVEYFVRHGVSSMPFFRKTEIGDSELKDLAAWVARNGKK